MKNSVAVLVVAIAASVACGQAGQLVTSAGAAALPGGEKVAERSETPAAERGVSTEEEARARAVVLLESVVGLHFGTRLESAPHVEKKLGNEVTSAFVDDAEGIWMVQYPKQVFQSAEKGRPSKSGLLGKERAITVALGAVRGDLKYVVIDNAEGTEQAPAEPAKACAREQLVGDGGEVWSVPSSASPALTLLEALEKVEREAFAVVGATRLVAHYVQFKMQATNDDCPAWSIDCRGIPNVRTTGGRRSSALEVHHLRHIIRAVDGKWLTSVNNPRPAGCTAIESPKNKKGEK